MSTTPTLTQRDLAVLWHPGSQMRDYIDFPPLQVVGAQGSRIRLADGRELIDAISSWWCKSLGHRHPAITAAIRDQLDRFEHVILANTTNEPIVRLCERLCHLANDAPRHGHVSAHVPPPPHFTRVFFADNGSTAVEVAIKMALQAQNQRGQPQRTRLASLTNGYHGETAAALSVSDCDLYRQHYPSLLLDVAKVDSIPYRSGPDDPRWMDAADQWPALEAQLQPIADTLAALIYEPVLQGAGNMRLYSPDLLPRLRQWADAHGVYLIADEIATGFYRLGAMFASHLSSGQGTEGPSGQEDATAPSSALGPSTPGPLGPFLPDFLVLSKGLTAGTVPMSVVLTTDAVYDLFDADYTDMKAFLHSNTYAGNALAVAAAHAALDQYLQDGFVDHIHNSQTRMRQALTDLAESRPYMKHIRGCGMMAAVDLCHEDGSPLDWQRRTGYRVYRHAVAHPTRPALLRPIGDTLYLFPPLNTPASDLEALLATLADSLDAVFL